MITLDTVRRILKVERTEQDVGETMTIIVTRYDNGMVNVNGLPLSKGAGKWLRVARVMMQLLEVFEQRDPQRGDERERMASQIRGYKASKTKRQNSAVLGYNVESEAARKAAITRSATS